MIPILAFDWLLVAPTKLNLSLLQFVCSEACGPIRDFHLLRPGETVGYVPLAISVYSELIGTLENDHESCFLAVPHSKKNL